ncbi:MAG: hypothetical protein PUC18_12555 [Prevotellaceae bacterium]|nr:hypothetical protein [Prevotellaceae bacterium]
MASRHEIVTIDFRANAAKANPAMESLRLSAKDCRTEIERLNKDISHGIDTGMPKDQLEKLGKELSVQEKKLRSFETAMSTLSKGVGTLARAIDAFNSGSLNQMSAAFQKAAYNAAEVAKKALSPLSETYAKDMAELDALQQKNLENLAKFKLRTEQMLKSIGEGGKISSSDLKQEADGIKELMQLLPHMSNEWQEYNTILTQINDTVKQQADAEQRLKGAIVDANDARERARQLTRDGAEAAARESREAEKEVSMRNQIIDGLKKEREEKAKQVSTTAALVQAKEEDIKKQEKKVAGIQREIDNEKKNAEAKQKSIDKLNQEATTYENTAKSNREAVGKMREEVKGLDEELKKVNEDLAKMGEPKQSPAQGAAAAKEGEKKASESVTVAKKDETAATKESSAAKEKESKASKENAAAKEQEAKAGEKVAEAQKKEELSLEELEKKQISIVSEINALIKERDELTIAQEKGVRAAEAEAAAAEKEANAFKNLGKEQAEALLKQKQALATITRGADGKISYTNAEEAQNFLIETIGSINPKGKSGNAVSLENDAQVAKLRETFKTRYGLQDEADVKDAIKGLLSSEHGGLIKGGMMNNFFSRIDLDPTKVAAYTKEIKDLTEIVKGETKATEGESQAKKELEGINRRLATVLDLIESKTKESLDLHKLRRSLMTGEGDATEELTNKTEKLSEANKRNAESVKEQIEAIKKMSAEEAKASLAAMTKVSTVGYKEGKLDMSNPQEVQSWIIARMRERAIPTRDGRISVSGSDVDSILSGFQNRYGWTGDKKTAKDLLKEIIQGRDGGLLKEGGVVDYNVGTLMIKQNNEEYASRVAILKELVAASKGAEQSTAKSTETTKKDVQATDAATKATEKETDAIQKQIEEVERRRKAYEKANTTYEEANTKLKGMRSAKSRLPISGLDAQLARHDADENITDFNENTVKPARAERTQLKKLWEQSVKQLLDMQQKSTDAENKEAEATEKNTKSKRGKKKAVEEVTAAQKESNKVEEESVKSGEKLSAEDQKRLEMEKKKQELESQRSAKLDEINKKEEEAAGLEVKANNNRSEAARKTNELANAHGNNAEKMEKESEVLEKLRGEQKANTDQLSKQRTELDGIDQKIDENAEARVKAEQKQAQAQKLTIDMMNDAIKALEAENRTIEPQSAKWNENVRVIQQYKAEVDRLKNLPVMQMMTERLGNIKNLSNDALVETKKFWQAVYDGADRGSHKMDVAAGSLRMLIEEERQRNQELQVPMRERLNRVGRLSTADLAETKKYWQTRRDSLDQYIEDSAGNLVENREYRKAVLATKTVENEENRRKTHAQAQLINDQMQRLNTLSVQGLADVKRYWQAMADGAARGSDELKDAEAALRRIERLESEDLKASAGRLNGNLGNLSQGDLRQAIEDAKKFQLTLGSTSKEAQELSKRIVEAEDFVRRYGVEAERAARKQEEADKRAARAARDKADADMLAAQQERTEMKQRSLESRRKTLSAEALAETKKYWEAVAKGAEEGSVAQRNALTIMERITAEEQRRATIANEKLASKLGGNLSDMSDGEIRQSIEAGKQLIQTYKSGSAEAEALAKNIVAAEEHVKQYGVEAQRAAVREQKELEKANQQRQETMQLMEEQLRRGTGLTQSTLRTQEQYWQRLIDDPKAAAAELTHYFEQLEKVHAIQKEQADAQVKVGGISVLQRMRGDVDYENKISENQRKEDVAALKAYRDSLPKEGNLSVLKEIEYYLGKLSNEAKQAAQATMSLADAEILAGKLGTQGFSASTNQLKLAKKALEDELNTVGRGTERFKKLQEAINKVDLELAKTGEIAKNVQDTLDQPKGKSINELKQAVEQGRVALNAMDRSTKEGQKQFDTLAKKIKEADFELKRLTGTAKGTASAFDKAWSRLKTYIGLYVGAAVAMQKIVATMGDLMELSDKMGEVRKTTGFTADEVGRLSDNLKKLDVRTSLTSLMELSSLAGSVGLKTQEDVQGFTEAANQLMVALPEMGNESARTLIKIATATGDLKKNNNDVRETLERVGSTIIALRANSASAAPAITDFVSRVGAVGAQAGISIDQIAALGSTIDALGGRVEMSATALSRMIPAIRNNAFGVANAIGVTEKTLTDLFNQGKAMEAMVLIFQKMRESVKQFDTSTEEGMNAMADNVEALLGKNASMAEVMKELNQQGARAGIVFGLLSQNVDELRTQLGIADKAYRENIALLNEFNNMNETTAAKWEKLKNEFEEMFVSDSAQKTLGDIIDFLRTLVNFLSGRVNPALQAVSILLRSIVIALIAVKVGAGDAFTAMINWVINLRTNMIKLTQSFKAFYAANKANLWIALAMAVYYASTQLYDWYQRLNNTVNALADAEATFSTTARQVGLLFHQFKQLTNQQEDLEQSTLKLRKKEAELANELEILRKKLGEGAEKSETFKKKQDELAKAHEEVAKAEDKARESTSDRLAVIKEINSKYSEYLGYMLSEVSTAETVASAHDLIIASLKEEMYWREKNKAFETVTQQHAENLKDYREASLAELNGMDAMRQQNIMSAWQGYLSSVTYDAAQGGFIIPGAEKAFQSIEEAMEVMKQRFGTTLSAEGGFYMVNPADKQSKLEDWWGESGAGGWGSWTRWTDRGFKDWTREQLEVLQETALLQNMSGSAATKAHETTVQKAIENTNALIEQAQNRNKFTNRQLAEAIVGIEKNISKYGEVAGRFTQFGADTSLKGIANVLLKDLPEETRKAVEAEIQRVAANGTNTPPKPTKEPNPYGDFNRVTDTYDKWDADSLVNRRKEMLERVRALANGADVQAVLSEDAKFITEATRKNIKTTRDAIEWYNTERLKIQDALHEKHLTNTGDWLDPTQKKGREKTLKAEWKEYLDELDAYYTARKTKIQDARNDEMITEAEAWRRTLQNDAEWRQRRAELQQLYANKSAKVTAEETEAIYEILAEQTGESSDYIKKDIAQTVKFILAIGAKSKDEMEKLIGQIDKGTEQDFFRQRVAIGKQMDAIADIIEKERPFNGITENLQANLTKMGVLQADFEKKRLELVKKREDTSELDKEYEAEVPKRIAFLLEEAEHAYNTTIEEVVARMEKAGMTAWADEIKSDTMMQEALMGQLHSTFDKVQEAIKKEASLWKKEAENMWNNILMPDGKTTLKQLADQVTAQLSLDANRVGRANNLIGAGQASERVVDKLAIQQMKVQLAMQQHYYNLMRERGQAAIKDLERQAALAKEREDYEEATRKELDAQHARMALNLATTKEQTELAKQQEEIIARTEESQNRLYKELKSWAELLASSMQELFEAEHAGDREYYNERAKLALTGKGGPGAGTYVVIENEGTSSAKAHYEYLSEEEALEREHQIEIENARAEAWKKVMDEVNEKLNDAITDQINAMLQNQSIDANTQAVIKNTEALAGMTSALGEKGGSVNIPSIAGAGNLLNGVIPTGEGGENETGVESGAKKTPVIEVEPLQNMEWEGSNGFSSTSPYINPNQEGADFWQWEGAAEAAAASAASQVDSINKVQTALDHQFHQQLQGTKDTNDAIKKNTQSMFASMTAAANLYGVAYQAMSNDNLSTSQKFQMIALQAAGNAAISGLTAALAQDTAETTSSMPAILAKCLKINPIWGSVLFGALTATLGGLMGMAASKITKSKAQIAQATGASAASAGKLTTGMLTYAEGNVNEFTDPGTLTEGRHYNVDAADGRTYRAKYMGKNAKTHITNGPEFHLVGEKGREAIIDAKTTRQIQMDDNGIWRSIQTLYNGGRISSVSRRRGRGVRAFADGNIDEFDSVDSGQLTVDSYIDIAGMQASLDRNSAVQEALLERLSKPIQAKFDVYGKGGLVDSYDTGKKTVNRHGERY